MHPSSEFSSVRCENSNFNQNIRYQHLKQHQHQHQATSQKPRLAFVKHVKHRILFKTAVLTHRCLNGLAPHYLSSLISPVPTSRVLQSFSSCSPHVQSHTRRPFLCQGCSDPLEQPPSDHSQCTHHLEISFSSTHLSADAFKYLISLKTVKIKIESKFTLAQPAARMQSI